MAMDDLGYQGAGYIDPVTGEWIPTPGTGINSVPNIQPPQASPQPGPRIINTPNSSTGQPSYADPSAPNFEFATPRGGPLVPSSGGPIITPNSSTGAPVTIRNLPIPVNQPAANQPVTFQAGQPIPGTSKIVGPLSLAPVITAKGIENYQKHGLLNTLFPGFFPDYGSPQPKSAAPAPAPATDTTTQTPPMTLPSASPSDLQPPPPVPPLPPTLPPGLRGVPPPRPMVAAPLPYPMAPPGARTPAAQPGAVGAPNGPMPPAAPPVVNLGYYRPTVGNARSATFVPGVYGNPANPPPQIYRGPTTMWGAPYQPGSGPAGAQNYYIPGSAPMGPGDWTGTGPVAGALAARPAAAPGNARGGQAAQVPYPPPRPAGLGTKPPPASKTPAYVRNAFAGGIIPNAYAGGL